MAEVRAASQSDAAAIRNVHLQTFPTSLEANLVDCLNANGDAVISLIAEENGEIVGHVLLSRMDVQANGRQVDALGLGPVAVLPNWQRQGVGSALIDLGLAAARKAGTEMVFVLGEPDYYGRFGFDAAAARPFSSPYEGPYFQALLLNADGINASAGRADYAPAFQEVA